MKLTEGQKQAIDKLDAEMEAAKDPCSKYTQSSSCSWQHPAQRLQRKSLRKRRVWQVRWML